MNPDLYQQVWRDARGWAKEPIPAPVPPTRLTEFPGGVGVYVACDPMGNVQYVGSVLRPHDDLGVVHRIQAHPVDRWKEWYWFWFVPLADDTPLWIVRAVEAHAIARLTPIQNRSRPKPRIIPRRG